VPTQSEVAPTSELALGQARRLHEKAVAEGRFGHAARAIKTLRRALVVLDGCGGSAADALVVEVTLSLAVNEAEVHGLEDGLAVIEEAGRLVDKVGDPALRVRMHNNYAHMATRAGDLELAREQLDLAMPMLAFATPHDRIYTLLNSGNVRLYRGQLGDAERLFRQAAAAAETDGILDGRFRALHNLGYVEFLAGNIPGALASMDEAAELDVDVSRGIWALDRARILVESGLTQQADDTLAQAEAIFRADRLSQDLGETEVARAECALVTGDVAAARRFATRARDRFRRRGNVRWQRTAELVLLQGDLRAGRPGSRLAPVAERLAAELLADGMPLRARIASLVRVEALLSVGQLEQAADVVRGLGRDAANDPITARTHSRYVRARLDVARGDRAAARRHIRTGLATLAGYQARFGGIDLRTASAVHGRRLAELDLSMALQDGRPSDVFAAVERARAVSSRLPAVLPPPDAQAAELLSELRQVVESLRAAQSDTVGLLRRRRDLEGRLQARTWTLAGAGDAQEPASEEETRAAAVHAGVALVSYLQVGGHLHAVVVDVQRSRLVDLGEAAEVDELVRRARADFDVIAFERLPAGLRAAATGSLLRSLTGLDDALLTPLGLTDQGVIVVPTGVLGTVPWTVLPSRRGLPSVVAPSATAWLAAHGANAASERGVVALAGPNLDRAKHEVQEVARTWAAGVADPVGDRSALLTAFAQASIVHVAAHGQHQIENPLFSSIQLADGALFAHELARTAPHVVLSACELGLATVRPGDEALGLTSVLLQRGTRSVIGGVARVGDDAAAEAMIDYHRLLAGGLASDVALAKAVADAPLPLPFVCFGAGWSAASAAA
jgi:tetratricopeptide (TPR) repeat protein